MNRVEGHREQEEGRERERKGETRGRQENPAGGQLEWRDWDTELGGQEGSILQHREPGQALSHPPGIKGMHPQGTPSPTYCLILLSLHPLPPSPGWGAPTRGQVSPCPLERREETLRVPCQVLILSTLQVFY
jgi:hypothetical protein